MDAREAAQQIQAGVDCLETLAVTAHKHNAVLKDKDGKAQAAEELPAIVAMKASADALATYAAPQLQLSSPCGIAVTTPADAVLSAGATTSISAGQDINVAAQGHSLIAAVAGISLFTYGKATTKDKPVQETGIRLHAASGRFSSQSQSAPTRITADKAITLASVSNSVTVAARQHVLLTAQGACLKLEGGNISLHGPGKVEFKASMKELAGPADGSIGVTALPKARDIYNEAFVVVNEETKQPMAYVRYRLESASGVVIEGMTDALGRTQRVFTPRSETLKLFLPHDD
jgi:type VI secretion system secreted protein VgrG